MDQRATKQATQAGHRADDIATGRRVLGLEAAALTAFAQSLGDNFADAVELMAGVQGRIIVSGMGKSGHVGHKIAATLASTGTPAQFVHPAEASHGDLGMVTRADVALVLSNSGETPELADVIAHTRRFDIPLIGVASRADSTLMQASDIALMLPVSTEACPNGLAPTTSTTLTLALGDALAVALMERGNFQPEHYRVFHPGGKLGARLIKVRDLMHAGSSIPSVSRSTLMGDALIEMSKKSFGVLAVLDETGVLAGVITDGDLRRHMSGLLDRTAGEVMTADPKTVTPDALAVEALGIMNDASITSLFVSEEGERRLSGILHIHDCLRAGVD